MVSGRARALGSIISFCESNKELMRMEEDNPNIDKRVRDGRKRERKIRKCYKRG